MSYMSFEIPSLLSAHVMSPRHVNHRLATTTLALMHRYRFDHHKPRIRWKSTSCAKGISFLTEHCLQLKRLGFTKGFHELPDSTESAISLDTYIWWDICDQPNVYIFCSAVAVQFLAAAIYENILPIYVGKRRTLYVLFSLQPAWAVFKTAVGIKVNFISDNIYLVG